LPNQLKNYYYNGGKDKGFLGILWYQLISNKAFELFDIEHCFGVIHDDSEAGDGIPIEILPAYYWLRDELVP
jgi:hypothetical protein